MEQNHEEFEGGRREGSKHFLAASILVAAVIVGGSLIYSSGRKALGPDGLAQVAGGAPSRTGDALKNLPDDDVILGDPEAPVTLVEWGDYQCPFCGKVFLDVEPKIREAYVKTGKVKMVYRDFAFLGPESTTAALAAECAGAQGKYWPYHDRLFGIETADQRENSGNLTPELMRSIAGELQLDRVRFGACLDGKEYQAEIDKDYADGIAAGVSGTPASFVNGHLLSGAQPYEAFKQIIEDELAKASKK